MTALIRKGARDKGFSVVRVLFKVTIVAVSMVSTAALLARISPDSGRSRYWSIAGKLAAEKLEELKQYTAIDPRLAVPDGKMAGSLTSDISQDVAAGTGSVVVQYYDEVVVGKGGAYSETVKRTPASSRTERQKSHRTLIATATSNSPTSMTFKRRWLIQKDIPMRGMNRVTVLVSLEGAGSQLPVTYQLSAARP